MHYCMCFVSVSRCWLFAICSIMWVVVMILLISRLLSGLLRKWYHHNNYLYLYWMIVKWIKFCKISFLKGVLEWFVTKLLLWLNDCFCDQMTACVTKSLFLWPTVCFQNHFLHLLTKWSNCQAAEFEKWQKNDKKWPQKVKNMLF